MRLSFPNPTSFLLLLLPLQTISSPAPEPIPGGLAIQTGPITVPVLSFGGAVAAIQGSRVYYQGADGALHELVGSGSPSPTNNYNDQIILPAGKARIASPLAVVDYNNNLQIVREPLPLLIFAPYSSCSPPSFLLSTQSATHQKESNSLIHHPSTSSISASTTACANTTMTAAGATAPSTPPTSPPDPVRDACGLFWLRQGPAPAPAPS